MGSSVNIDSMYRRSFRFLCHNQDLRVVTAASFPEGGIITGSRDTLVKLWTPVSDVSYKESQVFRGAKKFIASLCSVPQSDKYPEGLILAGSNDAVIYGFVPNSNEPVVKLLGHTDVVCALSYGSNGTIASGSWDKTAILWAEGHCVDIMSGHDEAVWAVKVYPLKNIVLTGSADRTIRIWQKGICKNVLYGHEDCVRDLAIDRKFQILSCSNDMTVRIWNIKGHCLDVYRTHTDFIYSITMLNNEDDFATCGEDGYVRVCVAGRCVQSIKMPVKTLWSIDCLSNGDLAVGCCDGSLIILTRREADEVSELSAGDKDCDSTSMVPALNMSYALDVDEWTCDSQLKDTESYREEMQLDLGGAEENKDFEFYVEIEGKTYRVDMDEIENPYEVAEKHCAKYSLDPSHASEITNYILKSIATLPEGTAELHELQPLDVDSNWTAKEKLYGFFPLKTYFLYKNANVAGLKAKLLEFNDQVPKSQNVPPVHIENLINIGNLTKHAEFGLGEMKALETLMNWSDEYLFPVLDLLRLCVLSEDESMRSSIVHPDFTNHLLNILRKTTKNTNQVLVVKIFCNLFELVKGRETLIRFQGRILDSVKNILSCVKTHKAVSSLYMNYSVMFSAEQRDSVGDFFCDDLFEMCKMFVDSDALYKVLVAIGTLSTVYEEIFKYFDAMKVDEVLNGCKKHVEKTSAKPVLEALLFSFGVN